MGADSSAVKRPLRRGLAPRAFEAGAFSVVTPASTRAFLLAGAFVAAPLSLGGVVLSAPPFPFAMAVQTQSVSCLSPGALVAVADSLLPGVDSTGRAILLPAADSIGGASLPAGADSTGLGSRSADAASAEALADSVPVARASLPAISSGPAPSYGLGVWCWDREKLRSTRAITLAELVSLVPGVIALKGGDYGTPSTVMSFGAGGGRVRVLWDGFEWMPLDGAVPDLARVSLAGLDEVRVERHPGELLITLKTSEPRGADPSTLVHVGTGDLGTNLLRGVFLHPNAFRGAFSFALDRLETRGPGLDAAGSLSGFSLRYAVTRGDRGGIVAEMKRFAPRTEVADLAAGLTRNDWNVRARWLLLEGLTGEGYFGASSLSGGPEVPVYGGLDTRRTQLGFRTQYTIGDFWMLGAARRSSGHGVPGETYEIASGGAHGSGATLDGSMRVERWARSYAASWRVRVETPPVRGFSLFAAYENGEMGAPYVSEHEAYLRSLRPGPPEPTEPLEKPRARFSDRTGVRAGGSFSWRGLDLSGAWLSLEADLLRPLRLGVDPGGITVAGGKRTGFEGMARIPLPLSGFVLEGAVQSWDDGFAYLPKSLWDGALTYHGIFKESQNLELWGSLGVTHRDLMSLSILEVGGDPTVPNLAMVPVSEEWYTHIQVRIVTLNLFVRWENMLGKANNLDFPDRTQARIRTIYGVSWIMNN
jgi:hypothetical protein